MGAWQPDESATVDNRAIYLWIVPARVGGKWVLRVENSAQDRLLSFAQNYQDLTGWLSGAAATLRLSDVSLRGDRINFTVIEGTVQRNFRARVRGRGMDGIVRAAGSPDLRWSASRR
jgi:hypothetical protein